MLNQNAIYQVSGADLHEFALTLIERTKKELEAEILSDKTEKYLSPNQASEMLGVDVTTLWRWSKRLYLIPSTIGGKRRYKLSEIKALLNGECVK